MPSLRQLLPKIRFAALAAVFHTVTPDAIGIESTPVVIDCAWIVSVLP